MVRGGSTSLRLVRPVTSVDIMVKKEVADTSDISARHASSPPSGVDQPILDMTSLQLMSHVTFVDTVAVTMLDTSETIARYAEGKWGGIAPQSAGISTLAHVCGVETPQPTMKAQKTSWFALTSEELDELDHRAMTRVVADPRRRTLPTWLPITP